METNDPQLPTTDNMEEVVRAVRKLQARIDSDPTTDKEIKFLVSVLLHHGPKVRKQTVRIC
jgi:hypothetical protein